MKEKIQRRKDQEFLDQQGEIKAQNRVERFYEAEMRQQRRRSKEKSPKGDGVDMMLPDPPLG